MGGKIAGVLHRNKQSAARVFAKPDQTSAPDSKRLSNQTGVIRLQLAGPIEYQDSSALRETEMDPSDPSAPELDNLMLHGGIAEGDLPTSSGTLVMSRSVPVTINYRVTSWTTTSVRNPFSISSLGP